MIQTVVKRDGRIVGFNEEKIVTAIRKAMLHTDKGEDLQLIHQITDRISFKGDSQMTVEAIQDLVEVELMKSSRKDVAQKYIAYRNQRSIARKAKTRDMFLEIINIKSNDITRENANMNADTPAGMMMKFASETTKPFVDDYLLSEEVLDAVTQNYLHIHDKDYYPTKSLTCVQHPLDHILKYGFSAGHGESRPAKRIETASILGCISLETAQNEMHGGQAIPAFDFYLAPYVRNSFIEEVKNLEELKTALKENLAQRKTMQIDEAKADQITEKLADMLDFNLPEAVVEREVYGILQQKMQQAMYSGNAPADMDKFVEEAREEARKEAKRNLKVFFMLQEVAQVEKIAVTEMELYNEVARQARQQKKNLKSYIRELQREGRVHGIRMSLLTAKVLDFLTKEAKVTVDEQ